VLHFIYCVLYCVQYWSKGCSSEVGYCTVQFASVFWFHLFFFVETISCTVVSLCNVSFLFTWMIFIQFVWLWFWWSFFTSRSIVYVVSDWNVYFSRSLSVSFALNFSASITNLKMWITSHWKYMSLISSKQIIYITYYHLFFFWFWSCFCFIYYLNFDSAFLYFILFICQLLFQWCLVHFNYLISGIKARRNKIPNLSLTVTLTHSRTYR